MLNSSCGYAAVLEKLRASLVLGFPKEEHCKGAVQAPGMLASSESGGSSSSHRQWCGDEDWTQGCPASSRQAEQVSVLVRSCPIV